MAENHNEPVSIMAASFGRKTMLLPQVLWSVLKIFISEIDRKYAENMRYPRPRLGRPNSFSGRSLGKNFVAQTNFWSHLATMRPAVSSTVKILGNSCCLGYLPCHINKDLQRLFLYMAFCIKVIQNYRLVKLLTGVYHIQVLDTFQMRINKIKPNLLQIISRWKNKNSLHFSATVPSLRPTEIQEANPRVLFTAKYFLRKLCTSLQTFVETYCKWCWFNQVSMLT